MLKEVELATRLKDSPAFWSKVRKTDTCWLWAGCLNHRGYGCYGKFKAHRLVHIMFGGSFAVGQETDHLCRVHNCVNPAHIEAVTKRVNILRGESFSAVNSRKTHCPKGHEYSGENLRVRMNGKERICLVCKKANNAKITKRRQIARLLAWRSKEQP